MNRGLCTIIIIVVSVIVTAAPRQRPGRKSTHSMRGVPTPESTTTTATLESKADSSAPESVQPQKRGRRDDDDDDNEIFSDFQTSYVTIPERGLLLTRTGSLVEHADYDMATIVVKIHNLDIEENAKLYKMCDYMFKPIEDEHYKQQQHLQDMASAILQSRQQLTSANLCKTFELSNCDRNNSTNSRQKRFLFGIIASATAASAMGISLETREQTRKITLHLDYVDSQIDSIEEALSDHTRLIFQQHIAITDLYGYVKELQVQSEYLIRLTDCVLSGMYYRERSRQIIKNIESTLQFMLNGQTHGRVTPSLFDTNALETLVQQHVGKTSTFYTNYKNILYQTATATIVQVDFDRMFFRFLIMYPNFNQAVLSPFFAVKQVGFIAQDTTDQKPICLMFQIPKYAILKNDTWNMITTETQCPVAGNIMLCRSDIIELVPFNECLRIQNVSAIQCPMKSCTAATYISTEVGVLIRTKQKTVTLTTRTAKDGRSSSIKQTATAVEVEVPPYQTIFVKWNSTMRSVQFDNMVVFAPPDIDETAQVFKQIFVAKPNLTWTDILNVPDIGPRKIEESLRQYESEIARVEALFSPRSIVDSILEIPKWIKAGMILLACVCCIVCILWVRSAIICMVKYLPRSKSHKKTGRVKRSSSRASQLQQMAAQHLTNTHARSILMQEIDNPAQNIYQSTTPTPIRRCRSSQYIQMYPRLPTHGTQSIPERIYDNYEYDHVDVPQTI